MNALKAAQRFDAFEVHPSVLLDYLNRPIKRTRQFAGDPRASNYEPCLPDDPNLAVWSFYGHLKEGGLEHLSDHRTRKAAGRKLARAEARLAAVNSQKPFTPARPSGSSRCPCCARWVGELPRRHRIPTPMFPDQVTCSSYATRSQHHTSQAA